MNIMDWQREYPHRRYNPLTGEWVLVSPHRTKRPWQGQVEKPALEERPAYDPHCYLCPGNDRAGGNRNPVYETTYVFTNDFQAILPDTPPRQTTHHPLYQSHTVRGTSRVICFSPKHNLTLAKMDPTEIRNVIDVWAEQTIELRRQYRWVQVFENRGAMMGASNPHPHGQIWASDCLPNEPAKEDRQQRDYYAEHHRPLLLDYCMAEAENRERIVVQNEHWLAIVPYWAIWPYECLLLPKIHAPGFADLDGKARKDLADILKRLSTRYDNLFETSFPYSMGWHGAPAGSLENRTPEIYWQLHAHFYPPLLRSATIRKFLVGYEMLAEPQRDITAEEAAQKLASLSDTHYRNR